MHKEEKETKLKLKLAKHLTPVYSPPSHQVKWDIKFNEANFSHRFHAVMERFTSLIAKILQTCFSVLYFSQYYLRVK